MPILHTLKIKLCFPFTAVLFLISMFIFPIHSALAETTFSERMRSFFGKPTLMQNEPLISQPTNPVPANFCDMANRFETDTSLNDVVLPTNIKIDSILVSKTHKKIWIVSNGKAIRVYDIALGYNPLGHKFREGDGRTPEGRYYIRSKDTSNGDFYPDLEISYPNSLDKKRSQEAGFSPGDGILIHGFPKSPDKYKYASHVHPYLNWTLGCIAVNDTEIEEIFSLVPIKTIIDICP